MKCVLVSTVVLLIAALACKAGALPDDLVRRLTTVIREHCPDATIEVTNGLFTAKHRTMMFTLHAIQMDGEITSNTRQEEGPNFNGFLLTVCVVKGSYHGQGVIPQELHGPYYPTFIDGPPTEDGENHYWINFSYGSRLDPKLKRAIFHALPNRMLRQDDPVNGSQPIDSSYSNNFNDIIAPNFSPRSFISNAPSQFYHDQPVP